MTAKRRVCTSLISLGLTLAASAAWAADLVVLEARGVNLRPGQTIDSTRPLVLKQGQHVTLISPTGATLKLDGPYQKAPDADQGRATTVSGALALLVTQRQARIGEVGTTRGTAPNVLPQPWLLDASHSGNGCLLENRTPVFWRPDAKAAARLTVTPIDRSWKAVATWPAGQNRLAITTDVPMQGGETYVIVFNDEEFAISMTLLPATLTNDDMRAAWMAEKGCEAQAEALSKK